MNCFIEIYEQWVISIWESEKQKINAFENYCENLSSCLVEDFVWKIFGWEPFKRRTLGPGYEEIVEGLEITQEEPSSKNERNDL